MNAITEVMGHTVNLVCINYCSIELFPSVGKGLGQFFSDVDDALFFLLNTNVISSFSFNLITFDQFRRVIVCFQNTSLGYDYNLCLNVYQENFYLLGKIVLLN